MSTPPELYTLPPDPRANACGAFFDELKSLRGKPVEIDASAVERMDTLVAQVMVLGQKTWAADNVPFRVTGASDTVCSALHRLGLDTAILQEGNDDAD